MKKLLICFTLFLTSALYCQSFQLSDTYSNIYTFDRIAQEVYFRGIFTDTVKKVNLMDMSETVTGRKYLLPYFANKHHLMLYGNNSRYEDSLKNNIILYNLDNGTQSILTDTLSFPDGSYEGSFSPNDSFFVYPGFYISLKDSSTKSFWFYFRELNDSWFEWSSDTSFVYLANDYNIVEYFLRSGRKDTLVSSVPYFQITGFAYNRKLNILAYSVSNSPPQNFVPRIYFHYINQNKPDSLFLDPERDEPDNPFFSESVVFTSLDWSPDESKLAFACIAVVNPYTHIRVYDLDSNKTNESDFLGFISRICWANPDTLIFSDFTKQRLFGLDVTTFPTVVNVKKTDPVPNEFTISNYPNPFNPTTTIRYILQDNVIASKAKQSNLVKLKIYNSLGQEVATLVNETQTTGEHTVVWNGTNNFGQAVSSGVYFATAIFNDKLSSNTIKLVLIK